MQHHIKSSPPPAAEAIQPYLFRFNLILFCASCAWIVWRTAWLIGSIPYDTGRAREVFLRILIPASGPFLAVALSLFALKQRSPQGVLTCAVLGIFIAACLLVSLFFSLGGMLYPGKSYISFLVGAALLFSKTIIGLLNFITTVKRPSWERERKSHLWIIVSVIGPLVALQVWSTLNIPIIAWRAKTIAGADPYCLEAPAGGYHSPPREPIRHWSELSGLRNETLYAIGDEVLKNGPWDELQVSFHSFLVVKRGARDDFYTWSHSDQSFVEVTQAMVNAFDIKVVCEPKLDFLSTLDVF